MSPMSGSARCESTAREAPRAKAKQIWLTSLRGLSWRASLVSSRNRPCTKATKQQQSSCNFSHAQRTPYPTAWSRFTIASEIWPTKYSSRSQAWIRGSGNSRISQRRRSSMSKRITRTTFGFWANRWKNGRLISFSFREKKSCRRIVILLALRKIAYLIRGIRSRLWRTARRRGRRPWTIAFTTCSKTWVGTTCPARVTPMEKISSR